MTMPSGTGWIGAHLALNHPLAACVVCLCGIGGWQVISNDVHAPTVVLTLDDAVAAQIEYGLPIAEEFDIDGTLYVNTQLVFDMADERGFYMTMDDVATFAESGWEVGAHTTMHDNLLELAKADGQLAVLETMQLSDAHVRGVTGEPANSVTFAYPYGDFDTITEALSASVFSYSVNAWSDANGINVPATFEPHNIHRFDVGSPEDVTQACNTIADLGAGQTYVVIVHDIVPDAVVEDVTYERDDWTLTVTDYRTLLTCINDAEVVTKTLRQAAIDLDAAQRHGDGVAAQVAAELK